MKVQKPKRNILFYLVILPAIALVVFVFIVVLIIGASIGQDMIFAAGDARRIETIKQLLLAGDYEQANSLYEEHFDHMIIEPSWKHYDAIVPVRDQIHYYRKYRLALDNYNSANKDWSKITSLLLDLPEGFVYATDASRILTEAQNNVLSAKPTTSARAMPKPTKVLSGGTNIDGVIVDGKTSWTQGAPDDRMATADELFEAVNNYRRTNNIPAVARNDTLCSIAQSRANELLANGQLDGHAGFEKYARGQKEFDTMDEILFGGVHPQLAVHIVEWGWDKSKTGHRDALQDRSLTDGCGGIAGLFAVFIFGAR